MRCKNCVDWVPHVDHCGDYGDCFNSESLYFQEVTHRQHQCEDGCEQAVDEDEIEADFYQHNTVPLDMVFTR